MAIKPKGQRDDTLQRALVDAASRAGVGNASIVSVACKNAEARYREIREAHAHFCNEKKTYVPLFISEGTIRFAMTRERSEALQAYMSASPHRLFTDHAELMGKVATASAAAALGAPSQEGPLTALPVSAIDVRCKEMANGSVLATLVAVRPGIAKTALESLLAERMQAAQTSLLEYLTLVPTDKLPGIGIAMTAAAFEVGSRLGMPVLTKSPEEWQERFGLARSAAQLIREAFAYQALSSLLPELLPGTGYEHHELVLASCQRYLGAMEEGVLGEQLPPDVVSATQLSKETISAKGAELYHSTVWD